jgi:hypothetical protein
VVVAVAAVDLVVAADSAAVAAAVMARMRLPAARSPVRQRPLLLLPQALPRLPRVRLLHPWQLPLALQLRQHPLLAVLEPVLRLGPLARPQAVHLVVAPAVALARGVVALAAPALVQLPAVVAPTRRSK